MLPGKPDLLAPWDLQEALCHKLHWEVRRFDIFCLLQLLYSFLAMLLSNLYTAFFIAISRTPSKPSMIIKHGSTNSAIYLAIKTPSQVLHSGAGGPGFGLLRKQRLLQKISRGRPGKSLTLPKMPFPSPVQDHFKQSTTRLYWIADKVIVGGLGATAIFVFVCSGLWRFSHAISEEMTSEMYRDPKKLVEEPLEFCFAGSSNVFVHVTLIPRSLLGALNNTMKVRPRKPLFGAAGIFALRDWGHLCPWPAACGLRHPHGVLCSLCVTQQQ